MQPWAQVQVEDEETELRDMQMVWNMGLCLQTSIHRRAEGQETGASKVEHQMAGPTRKNGEDREQARAGQGRAGPSMSGGDSYCHS